MNAYDAVYGHQAYIPVTSLPSGTSTIYVPLSGHAAIDVIVSFPDASAVTSARIYVCGADGVTQRVGTDDVDFSAFDDGVAQCITYSSLRGEKVLALEIITTDAVAVVHAEYCAL